MSAKPQVESALRSGRIPCPVHGGTDLNCEVRYNDRGQLRWARCYSHHCSRRAIIAALLGNKNLLNILANLAPTIDRAVATASAKRIWDFSQEIRGNLAEHYLRDVRGITIKWPSCLRFHSNVFHHRNASGDYYFPALIACAEIDGRFAGIHRTWLDPAATDLKLYIEPRKAALGTQTGAVVRLSPYLSSTIVLTEGIEDGLTLIQANPELTVWVALGSNLQCVRLPSTVGTVILAGDNDLAGRKAVYAAVREFRRQGRKVRTVFPPIGIKDFNDQLRLAHA
jgi:DNA primase